MDLFHKKVFEIGYSLMFSSVKISTYKYCKTKKILSFRYHRFHAHRFVFLSMYFTVTKRVFF